MDKTLYEAARKQVLAELGISKVSEMTEEQKLRYKQLMGERLKPGAAPETNQATEAPAVPPPIAQPEPEKEITEKEATAAVEAYIEGSNIPVILQSKIRDDALSADEPLIDKLELINLFDFTIYKGYAGIGKTSSVESWAKREGYDVFEIVCSQDMNTFDLVGSYIIRGNDMVFAATQITSAVVNSQTRKTLLIIDEINLLQPEVLKSLNNLTDFRKSVDTVVGRFTGKNLKIVGLMNVEAASAGNELDITAASRAVVHTADVAAITAKLIKAGVITKQLGEVFKSTSFAFGLREAKQLKVLVSSGMPNAVSLLLDKYNDDELREQIKQAFVIVYGEGFEAAVVKDLNGSK